MISQCIQQMAMKILKENPNIANNPNTQSMINVIQSGDEKKRAGDCREHLQVYGSK